MSRFNEGRRRFGKGVIGFVASEALNLAPAGVLFEWLRESGIAMRRQMEMNERLSRRDSYAEARMESIHRSPHFSAQIARFSRDYTKRNERGHTRVESELDTTLANGCQPTVNDALGRSRIDYISDEVMAGISNEKIPASVREELSFLLVGLPAVESRYQNDLVSPAGAQHLVQAMPATRERLHITEAQLRYLEHQVILVREHFLRDYEAFSRGHETRQALEKIREQYFENDHEAFYRQFVPLLLINSYNGGFPLVQKALTQFAENRPGGAERGYDVYDAFATWAKEHNIQVTVGGSTVAYGEQSRAYAERVFAFALLLRSCDTSAR